MHKPPGSHITSSRITNWLRSPEGFDDGLEVLVGADRMKLEGIVSQVSRENVIDASSP
jgi:hypothetical protein